MLSDQNRAAVIAGTGEDFDLFTERGVVDRLDRIMDAARAQGEQAGVQKAEQAAGAHIASLESKLLAALWMIPGDQMTGTLRAKFEQLQLERAQRAADSHELETIKAHLSTLARLSLAEDGRPIPAGEPLRFVPPLDTDVTDRSKLVAIERIADDIASGPCDPSTRRLAQAVGMLAGRVAPR